MEQEVQAHKEHVTPLQVYLGTAGALFVLTIITVAVSYVHFGAFNLVIAMGIATVKAALVALIFMHLYYDDKLYLTIFVMALLMLSLFIVITLFDTLRRDDIYQQTGSQINPEAQIYQQQEQGADGGNGSGAGEASEGESQSNGNSGH
jgi:cytochrome c oxidase subunit 4